VDWVAWYFPGGPVGSASGWAATSNVEVGQREGKSHKEEDRKGWNGMGEGAQLPLVRQGAGYLCRGTRVPSYTTADGAGLPGPRFEKPVRP